MLQVLIPIVLMTVVVVIIEEEEEVGAMVTIEEEEVMTITVEGVDLGVMMEGEAMTITVEGVVVVMVEVVHTEVIKVEKMVVMVKFLLLLPNLTVVLVETTHPLTVLIVVGMQVMEQKQFLHLQVILVDLIPILHHMGVAWVVMGEIIKGMDGVVVDLGLLLDMTVVTVLVIEVDLVDLLQRPLLQ